jgi:hypothetical protein
MLGTLQVVAVVLVGLVVVPSLAHALELPGRMRLRQEAYLAVQTIYHPGFTLASIAEPLALISTIVLLLLVPPGTTDFFFSFASASQAGSHGQIHPVSWTELRDRWEYSHLARAVLAVFSLIALVLAVS